MVCQGDDRAEDGAMAMENLVLRGPNPSGLSAQKHCAIVLMIAKACRDQNHAMILCAGWNYHSSSASSVTGGSHTD